MRVRKVNFEEATTLTIVNHTNLSSAFRILLCNTLSTTSVNFVPWLANKQLEITFQGTDIATNACFKKLFITNF